MKKTLYIIIGIVAAGLTALYIFLKTKKGETSETMSDRTTSKISPYCPKGETCPFASEVITNHNPGSFPALWAKLIANIVRLGRPSLSAVTMHHAAAFAAPDRHYGATYKDWHTKNNVWGYMGYAMVIEPDGSISTGYCYDRAALGIHVANHNTGNIGICVAGNFDQQQPTQAQTSCIEQIKAIIKATTPWVQRKTHKDFMLTSCPGKNFPYSVWK